MKKVLSMGIAVLFLLQIFTFNLVKAEEKKGIDQPRKTETVTFKDISGHWAESKINTLAEKGYLKGYKTEDGYIINPDSNITRAEYISILLKTVKVGKKSEKVKAFSDVKEGDWFKETVDIASSNGIVGCYPDGSFGASNHITRAEMAFILSKVNGWAEKQSSQNVFADVGSSDWYYDAVMTCKTKKIINGYPNGTFGPNLFATRAEAFAMVVNCINGGEIVKNEDVPAGKPRTSVTLTITSTPTGITTYTGGGGGKSKKKSTPTPTTVLTPTITAAPTTVTVLTPTPTVTPKDELTVEILSSSIIIVERGDLDNKINAKAKFKYAIKNQSGADVTSSVYSEDIKWSTSPYGDNNLIQVNKDQGVVTIVESLGKNELYDNRGKEMSVFATCYSKNISLSKSLKINPILGGVKEFKFTGMTNDGGLKEITRWSKDEFVLGYEAKDVDGNLIDYYDVFANDNIFRFSPDPMINGNDSKQDKSDPAMLELRNDNGKLKIIVKASDDEVADYGRCLIFAVCYSSGTSAQYEIDVKNDSTIESITLQAPEDAIAGSTVEIPYIAVDTKGRTIKAYDDIVGFDQNGEALTTFKLENNEHPLRTKSVNRKLKVFVDIDDNSAGKTITLTATVNSTGKTSRIQFKVSDSSHPWDISSAGSALLKYVTDGGKVDEDINCLVVKDEDGNIIDMKNRTSCYVDSAGNSVYYYVYVTSSNPNVVKVLSNAGGFDGVVYGSNSIIYQAGSQLGVATLKFNLIKDNDLDPTDGWLDGRGTGTSESIDNKVVDTYDMTVRNISLEDVTDYKLLGDATIWAIDPSKSRANLAGIDVSKGVTNAQMDAYSQKFVVKGYSSAGKEVAIPDKIVSGIWVTDQTNFKIIGNNEETKSVNIYGLRVDDDARSSVTATILACDKTRAATAEIKSSKKMPVAQLLKVDLAEPVSDGTGTVFKDMGYNIYEVTAKDLVATMNGKSLAKFNNDGTSANNAIWVELVDQYGKSGLIPEYITAVAKDEEGNYIDRSLFEYDSFNNVVKVSDSIPDKTIITVTATAAGKALIFSIRINNNIIK